MNDCEAMWRIQATASRSQCDGCPPERVCAWACVQGRGVEEIVIGAALAREDTLDRVAAGRSGCDALWDRYNSPHPVGQHRNPG